MYSTVEGMNLFPEEQSGRKLILLRVDQHLRREAKMEMME